MCPVRVLWHVKTKYLNQWRVKLTISNYNYQKNFSNWNMLVQHPGFSQPATIYSFSSTVLPTVGFGGNYCSTFLSTIDIQMLNCSARFFVFNVHSWNSTMLKVPTINVIVHHLLSYHEKFLDLVGTPCNMSILCDHSCT